MKSVLIIIIIIIWESEGNEPFLKQLEQHSVSLLFYDYKNTKQSGLKIEKNNKHKVKTPHH